jgi:hypothetical protein
MNVYYWGQIAALKSFEDMCSQLDSKASTPTDRTRHQLWELSRIVARKYRLLRGAFVLAAVAGVLFAASAALA